MTMMGDRLFRWLAAGGGALCLLVHSIALCGPVVRGESLAIEETMHDFGRLESAPGRKLSHAFLLKNQGTTPVRILRVDKTCSCTTATLDHMELPPGQGAYLCVEVEASGIRQRGSVMNEVTLQTDDPKLKEVNFQLFARFLAPFDCQPREIRLGRVQKGEICKRIVGLSGLGHQPLFVRAGRASSPSFRVVEVLIGQPAETERMAVLEIKADGDGFTSGTVCFTTDDPTLNEACVTISYDTTPAQASLVKPASLFLSAQPTGRIEGPPGATYRTSLDCLRLEATKSSAGGKTVCKYTTDPAALERHAYGILGAIDVLGGTGQSLASITVYR